jgi:hypothetical protein
MGHFARYFEISGVQSSFFGGKRGEDRGGNGDETDIKAMTKFAPPV